MTALESLLAQPGFAYVGTPYTRYPYGIDAAARDAADYAARLMKKGYRVFSPIAHSHAIALAGNIDPKDHDIWVAADKPFVEAASSLIVLKMEGWRESRGLAHEIQEFERQGKPIAYVNPGEI